MTSDFAWPVTARFIESMPPFSTDPFGKRTAAAVISAWSSSIGRPCPTIFKFNSGFSAPSAIG